MTLEVRDLFVIFFAQGLRIPSAKFKLLIFARKLIEWKMKIAVHTYFEERNTVVPLCWNLKAFYRRSAVRTDRGPQTRRTKCHNQAASTSYSATRLEVASVALFSAAETKAEKCVCSPQAIPWPATKQFHI